MAESENTDVGDPYLQNLTIKPARQILRESQLSKKGKDLRKRGFNKLRVVIIEAVFGGNCMLGSGILCPSVDDWPEFGEEVDELHLGYEFQWVLTAAHCVCLKKRSKCRLPDAMRIRIPKYTEWPSKKLKTFQPGPREALESKRFEDIMYDADKIKKCVHVYGPYKMYFSSTEGEDFALVQIPLYKSDLPPNTFQVWDTSSRPEGFSIAGFPAESDKSYLPYFDRRKEFSVFETSPRDPDHIQMYYTSVTSGGQSGGPVQFLNVEANYRAVVGVHVTGKDTDDGEASGCMITKKIYDWVGGVQKNALDIGEIQSSLEPVPSKTNVSKQQKAGIVIEESKRKALGEKLYQACETGDENLARKLISEGADVLWSNEKEWTPIWIAAYKGYVKCVQILNENGADVNAASNSGTTPAFVASQEGHVECLIFLAEHGANLEIPNNNGATPVYIASQNGHVECLEFLAKHGANLETPINTGATPAYIASMQGHVECLRFLAEHDADLSTPKNNGTTPYDIAESKGHLSCATFIQEHLNKAK